jgi:outer membrane protein OmpA-like peptidoglycan-associated protein
MVLKGTVKNDEGNPPADAQVEIKYAQSGEKEKIQINSDDGTYAAIVNLNKKEDVVVSVQGEGLAFNSRVIARKSDTHPAVVTKLNMDVPEEKPDKPFEIHDIIYTTGSASIEEDSKLILDEFADYLKLHTELKINILGHTDNIGDPKSNLALSKERAYEVLKYLASKGVDGARMKYEGYGDSKPRASNDSEEGRKLNRRTEFVIQKTK